MIAQLGFRFFTEDANSHALNEIGYVGDTDAFALFNPLVNENSPCLFPSHRDLPPKQRVGFEFVV